MDVNNGVNLGTYCTLDSRIGYLERLLESHKLGVKLSDTDMKTVLVFYTHLSRFINGALFV